MNVQLVKHFLTVWGNFCEVAYNFCHHYKRLFCEWKRISKNKWFLINRNYQQNENVFFLRCMMVSVCTDQIVICLHKLSLSIFIAVCFIIRFFAAIRQMVISEYILIRCESVMYLSLQGQKTGKYIILLLILIYAKMVRHWDAWTFAN